MPVYNTAIVVNGRRRLDWGSQDFLLPGLLQRNFSLFIIIKIASCLKLMDAVWTHSVWRHIYFAEKFLCGGPAPISKYFFPWKLLFVFPLTRVLVVTVNLTVSFPIFPVFFFFFFLKKGSAEDKVEVQPFKGPVWFQFSNGLYGI